MTAYFPVDSDRRLTTNVTLRITLPGSQQVDAKAIKSVLKTSSPENIVVRD